MTTLRQTFSLAAAAAIALAIGSGCTTPEEKLQRILDDRIAKCKVAEGTFHEVELFDGTDDILVEACSLPLEGPTMTDELHGIAKTGPYDWLFGLDDATGVWVLSSVSFDAIDDAKKWLAIDDPDVDTRKRIETSLLEAQKALPDTAWVRINRVENALKMRSKKRGKDLENPTGLGEAQAVWDENSAWAKGKNPAALATMQLAYLDHFADYKSKLELAIETMGSQDDWYAASIRQSIKEGEKETAAEYQVELDKMKAERPALREKIVGRLGIVFDSACKVATTLTANGIEDEELKKLVIARKSALNCAADARPKLADYEALEE